MRTLVTLSFLSLLVACGDGSGQVILSADGGLYQGGGNGADAGQKTGTDAYSPDPGFDSGSFSTPDTGTTTAPDTGTTTTTSPDGSGGTCPPASCTQDSDCACLGASGTTGCCDKVTTACFTSASTCPVTTTTSNDSGGGGGY
jgi:hypothetical protein